MCALLQRSAWPRGMVLGGSSSLNNLQYVRGSRHDYDRWAKEGCKGWSYKDVLPYFIKSEDIQIPELQNSGKNIRFVHQNFFSLVLFGEFLGQYQILSARVHFTTCDILRSQV